MSSASIKELRELCTQLFYETYPHGNSDEFLLHEKNVDSAIEEFSGLKTSLTLRRGPNVYDEIVIAALFSDFCEIYLDSSTVIIIPAKIISEWPSEIHPEVEDGVLPEHLSLETEYHFGFGSESFLRDLSPLVERGRMMLRPQRVIRSIETKRAVTVQQRTPSGLWLPDTYISDETPNQLTHESDDALDAQIRMAVVMPYIKNVSLLHLAKILDDEQDLLAEFRTDISSAIRDTKSSPDRIATIENDVVRPAVDCVNRRFKKIIAMHSLKIGGATLGSTAITLLSFADAGIAASFGRILGPAGLGLVAKEIAALVESRASLREMPQYMLWKIGRATKYSSE